jgi:hypothetical protein
VSSKAEDPLGQALSAFNLKITTRSGRSSLSVESAFQGSKVFDNGGPYKDLYGVDARTAKRDSRLKTSGNLTGFRFFGKDYPNAPKTFFYDWIYINALSQNWHIAERIIEFAAFSDIEFNPSKSINCQARSAALFVSLVRNDALNSALRSPENLLLVASIHYQADDQISVQGKIAW